MSSLDLRAAGPSDGRKARLASAAAMELVASITGELLTPASSGWDHARGAWNLSADQHPAMVLEAASPGDVQAAVRFARANGLRVATQVRGHGATDTVDPDVLLVNTRRMAGVTVDPVARRARVQAGARWQDLIPKAARYGLAGLAGSSEDVGIVG
jgi:FAD/FMN-containing dehydrogenase